VGFYGLPPAPGGDPSGSIHNDTPVARVWLLANDATPGAIASALIIEAVRLVLAGKGVLILAQRPEPEVDVRDGLLQALDLFTIPRDGARHA